MPKCSLCDVILWNSSQFSHYNHFCQGITEKDRSPILPYVKNRYNSHFIDKNVRDVKKLCQTIAFMTLLCGIGVRFPEIKDK